MTRPDDRLQTLGPEFTPQPGWGGRLSSWLRRRPLANSFRVLLIAILSLGFISFIMSNRPRQAEEATLTPPVQDASGYTEAARPGEGVTHLAERALNAYLMEHPRPAPLAPEQRLFVVDSITRSTIRVSSRAPLELVPGDSFFFSSMFIEKALWAADQLTRAQRDAWLRVLSP